MKQYALIVLVLFTALPLRSQTIIDSANIDYTAYKGKLIVMNEIHSVASNSNAYEHVIEDMAAQIKEGDTINIIGEWPYSYSQTQELAAIKNRGAKIRVPFYPIGLPVRIIGVDFERLYRKDNNTYTRFLDSIIIKLGKQNIPIEELSAYNNKIKAGDTLKSKARKSLISVYKKERKKFATNSAEYKTMTRLLFLLTGNHTQLPNMKKRDKGNYARLLEADKNGLITLKGNYNILIHGTCHTDPTKKHNIYNRFQRRRSSPFRGETYMITQTYIDCTSEGDYFRNTPRNVTGSIFCDASTLSITDFFKDRYKGQLMPRTVIVVPSGLDVPGLEAFKGRIIENIVHWRVPAQD